MSLPSQTSESIEFHCTSCGRALRVPASAAGKRASCPQCNTVVPVPLSTQPQTPATAIPPAPARPTESDVGSQRSANPIADARPPTPDLRPPTSGMPASVTFAPPPQPPAAPPPGQPASAPAPVAPALNPPAAGRDTPTRRLFDRITAEVAKIYVGQDELVLGALVALFSGGHVLIEAVPGLGKTLLVRTLGRVLGLHSERSQYTPELTRSNVTGAPMLDMKSQEFRLRPGPAFTQLLLCDEINRAPAKTHAALIEVMQEYRVTVDGKSHPLERPFLVLATQNPIESEGTYNLPEAQLDRFMFKLVASYPAETEEATILKLHSPQRDITERLDDELSTLTSAAEILETIETSSQVRIDDRLVDYINKIVRRTREWPQFHMGASPRAGIALMQAARTLAAFAGRDYAVPDDVVQIALPALRHRVALTAEAEVEGQNIDTLLTDLIRSVEVPRL